MDKNVQLVIQLQKSTLGEAGISVCPQPQKSPPQFSLKLNTWRENDSLWKLDFSFKR